MDELSVVQIIDKLQVLFDDKGWDLDSSDDSSMFNRFVDVLKVLNRDEQNLFLELTNYFDFFKLNQYEEFLKRCLYNFLEVEKDFLSRAGKKTVYVLPIMNEEEYSIKSSFLVAYLMKSNMLQYDKTINKIKWEVYREANERLINKVNNSPNKKILLVDDFVGSGNTVINFIQRYENKGLNKDKINIIALICTKKARKLLKEKDIAFYICSEATTLEDIYTKKEDQEEKLQLIKSITEKLGINNKNVYGYGDIMSLVSMIRTPNNTFPIFWDNSGEYNAPFPRF